MFDSVIKFIKYWYFRYLLVTELYMVEKWERAMIHVVFFIMLAVLYIFNAYVTLGLTTSFVGKLSSFDIKMDSLLPTSAIYENSNNIINSEL